MVQPYYRLLKLTLFLMLLLPMTIRYCHWMQTPSSRFQDTLLITAFCVTGMILLIAGFRKYQLKLMEDLNQIGQQQSDYLDHLPDRFTGIAIIGSSALSLLLQLAMIRWQGGIFPVFAFYKNYSLLSCFAGLGLGYALARKHPIPLILSTPILFVQILLLTVLRFGLGEDTIRVIWQTPFKEQLNMGVPVVSTISSMIAIYLFLTVIFLLTALIFIPIGQLCGRLMNRKSNLTSYGLNLAGSLLGVVGISVLSFLWTPPTIWFAICFLMILSFLTFRSKALMIGLIGTIAAIVVLVWPVDIGHEKIYSPYQLLERGTGYDGLSAIRASGFFYQQILDLSPSRRNLESDPLVKQVSNYYDLPYTVFSKPLHHVAVVGAGTGNDVAAAIRHGAEYIDAIEIDPGILSIGRMYHPEKPYENSCVHPVVNDARTFLRTTTNQYDMIVYGLLDSHSLLSHASNVRLDSFVYTVEGFREARLRLKPGGIVSLSFCVLSDELGKKIFTMMEEAFGTAPVCIMSSDRHNNRSITYFQSKEGTLKLNPTWLSTSGFVDAASFYTNPDIKTDVSTDDWPFFYMPRRVYPFTYLGILALIMALSVFITVTFIKEKPAFSNLSFFFLGAGFMLIETKAITEMGLAFGNTWLVIGIVISAILIMAFLANLIVAKFKLKKPHLAFALLLATIILGYVVSRHGGLDSTGTGKLLTAILLTCPVFFSGIVFSTLLSSTPNIAGIMAVNLLGSMLGGLLEYNAMYFGFSSLYLLALLIYSTAIVFHYVKIKR